MDRWQPPYNPRYHDNRGRCRDGEVPCFICGKPIKVEMPRYQARTILGALICTDAIADADPAADTGYYPIGNDCYRKVIPAEARHLIVDTRQKVSA